MKNIVYAFLLIGSMLTLGACSKEADTDGPSIEILKPETNEVTYLGKTLNMKFRFKDESGVGFYSYEIFSNEGVLPNEFTYKKELNIQGLLNDFEIDHSVSIPEITSDSLPIATGEYVLRVLAVDWLNNRSVQDQIFRIEKEPASN